VQAVVLPLLVLEEVLVSVALVEVVQLFVVLVPVVEVMWFVVLVAEFQTEPIVLQVLLLIRQSLLPNLFS
jgi:hypothetical protein